ncbi:MAG: hypothetical protein ACP5I6_07445 [Caldisphaera sp.]|nr:hypothetical protein [Caldisphaera sp.]
MKTQAMDYQCVQREAIFNAVSHGERLIKEILVATNAQEPAIPCGHVCRFYRNLLMIIQKYTPSL